ncbi:hypothetical protein DOT_2628 [Desulfosporosinus sp. OT]|nr:hypothetical protein DOT_2628 [Desulfosporosinus sp. OT]
MAYKRHMKLSTKSNLAGGTFLKCNHGNTGRVHVGFVA